MKTSATNLRFFKYPGGKTRILDQLYDCFPDHHTYIEPFGGSYVVILNKTRSKVELVNDIDPGIEALAYCLLLCPDDLLKVTNYEIHSQALFKFLRNQNFEKRTMLEKAICKLYLIYHSFSGIGDHFAYNINQDRVLHYNIKFTRESIQEIHNRISNIHIFSEDFRNFLSRFQRTKNGFIYLDPPYVVTLKRTNMYSYIFTKDDHNDLFSLLNSFESNKTKWLMSYDKDPMIENLYSNYFINDIEVPYSIINKVDSGHRSKSELLISNYDISTIKTFSQNQPNLMGFIT